MPANQKVSVGWQIVATFVPIANFWAFYRIRKLQKYLLHVIAAEVVISIIIITHMFGSPADQPTLVSIIGGIVGWALQGFAIYLVIIWSRQHNQSFDTPPTQT